MDTNIDAHLVLHNGNYVLIMSPFVARCMRDLVGSVDMTGKVRDATNLVWYLFTGELEDDGPMPYDIDDGLVFTGEVHPVPDDVLEEYL